MISLERTDLLIKMTPWVKELEPLLMYDLCEFDALNKAKKIFEVKKVKMFQVDPATMKQLLVF